MTYTTGKCYGNDFMLIFKVENAGNTITSKSLVYVTKNFVTVSMSHRYWQIF